MKSRSDAVASPADLEALRRQVQDFRDFIENAPMALHSVGPDGVILWANRAELERLGYSWEEYVGRNVAEFHVDQTVAEDMLGRLRRGETLKEHASQIRCRDGTIKDVLIDSNACWKDGEPVYSRCTTVEVTDRNQAEETRSLLAAIVTASDNAIVSKTLDGVIRSWNRGAERLLGYTAAEAVGQTINLIIPPELQDEERSIMERLRRGERVDHFETVRVAKGGRRVDLSLTISPVRDQTGRILGAVQARDISDRKRAERALLEADRRKNEFLAMLGHELRNPLAPMRNLLEVLKQPDRDPELDRRAHETMARQLDLLVRLVDDLLDVSRITEGKLRLQKERVDLAEVVPSVVDNDRELIDEPGHDLCLVLPHEPVFVDADPIRLRQILSNLLNNAARYTPAGGRIEIRVEADAQDARISVRDDGFGIPPGKFEAIFEMFTQIDHTLERDRRGMGIGLSLVKWLVELHGGRIEARSEGLGRGSEFEFRLPRVSAAERVRTASPGSRAANAQPSAALRVLVVDDNQDAAESLGMLVEMHGHEIRVAFDGFEAIRLASGFRPHVMLLDIGLPGLSGYDVARRIRRQDWGQGIVLAAVTGWGQEEDHNLAIEAGCDFHVAKPLTLQGLQTVLDAVQSCRA